MRQPFTIFAVLAGLPAMANALPAVTLAPAKYIVGIKDGATNQYLNVAAPAALASSSIYGNVSSTTAALPRPLAQLSNESTAIGFGVIANAYMTYQFTILNPANTAVHVLIDSLATATGHGSFYTEAEIALYGSGINKTLAYAHVCNAIAYCNTFANVYHSGGNNPYTLNTNKAYTIRLNLNAHTSNASSGFSVLADPVISFDPGYTVPAGSTLRFSANLPTTVPEPASWAMLVLGFGLVGAVRRRRQPAVAA